VPHELAITPVEPSDVPQRQAHAPGTDGASADRQQEALPCRRAGPRVTKGECRGIAGQLFEDTDQLEVGLRRQGKIQALIELCRVEPTRSPVFPLERCR